MHETKDHTDLPFAEKEITQLHNLLSNDLYVTMMRTPSTAAVVGGLSDHQIVHFACHGESFYADPSKSTIYLADWKSTPLTVSDIISLNSQSSQFAYLSACHTANMRNFWLLDQSIHLASAF